MNVRLATIFTAAVLAGVTAFATESGPADLLCLPPSGIVVDIPESCRAITELPAVEPYDAERPFALVSERGRVVAVGLLPPKATRIDLPPLGRLDLQLSGSERRGWPSAASMEMRTPKRTIELRLSASFSALLRELRLPKDRYDLTVRAPRHFPAHLEGISLETDAASLGLLVLKPLPRLSVKVVDGKGQPMGGAGLIDDVEQKELAVSDSLGMIDYEAENSLPERIAIASPGGARKTIRTGSRDVDVDLGTIELGEEGGLRIRVIRPEAQRAPLIIRIVRDFRERSRGGGSGTEVFKGALEAEADQLTIRTLEEGDQALYVAGPGPLEQYGTVVTVEPREVREVEVHLDPVELEGVVMLGEHPLADAQLEIGPPTAPGPQWKGKITADERGEFRAMIWQRGSMGAQISGGAHGSTFEPFEIPKSGSHHFQRFTIPDAHAEIRVVDDVTGAAVSNAQIHYEFRGKSKGGRRVLRGDEKGVSEIRPLYPGSHTIRIQHPGFLDAQKTFITAESDRIRVEEIRLMKGVEVHLQIVDVQGVPHPNAEVVQARGHEAPLTWSADAAGRVIVRMGSTGRRSVFVIPRDGSFANVVLEARSRGDAEAPERVVVPRAMGALRVHSVDAEGRPAPEALLAMRFNGVTIPWQILQQIAHRHGVRFQTGFDGVAVFRNLPAGRYEIWAAGPIRVPAVFEVPRQGQGATVELLGGEQEVTVTTKPFGSSR